MSVPAWLRDGDPLAAVLIARGMHSSEAMEICERAAIAQHDGGLGELDAIIAANGSCPHEIRAAIESQTTSQKEAHV